MPDVFPRRPWPALLLLALCPGGLSAQQDAAAPAARAAALHGRLEVHDGLRILRTWGTPEQRGYAHGRLLGDDVAATAAAEFGKRFGRRPQLLETARRSLERNIAWPEPVRQEIEALWRGLQDSGASLRIEELDRDLDLQDLLLANALDVYGLMGCSGCTVWGDDVDGGGVLTGRNFDWPFTGPHMVDQTLLLVQHLPEGRAVASVTWPGYVAVVTGVSSEGVAAFLHVGSAQITYVPEPDSWPTAVAARAILEQLAADAGSPGLERAQELLGYTSAPAGYITRVVLPRVAAGTAPVGVFEADRNKVLRAPMERCEVVTNHFQGRDDGRPASRDSTDRHKQIREGLTAALEREQALGPAVIWQQLQAVQRGGGRAFGTLHSLVFRAEPWVFELRVGEWREQGLVAAPVSGRQWSLPREALFPAAGAPR